MEARRPIPMRPAGQNPATRRMEFTHSMLVISTPQLRSKPNTQKSHPDIPENTLHLLRRLAVQKITMPWRALVSSMRQALSTGCDSAGGNVGMLELTPGSLDMGVLLNAL